MVTGRMIFIANRRPCQISDNAVMLRCLIDVASKCPNRTITGSADDEPDHEQTFCHISSLVQEEGVVEKVGDNRRFFVGQVSQ